MLTRATRYAKTFKNYSNRTISDKKIQFGTLVNVEDHSFNHWAEKTAKQLLWDKHIHGGVYKTSLLR